MQACMECKQFAGYALMGNCAWNASVREHELHLQKGMSSAVSHNDDLLMQCLVIMDMLS